MNEIKVEKLTLNIGVGEPGENLNKAMNLLKKITGSKPIETKAKRRIPSWGIRPGLSIGSKVTVRGKKAEELLKRLLSAINNILPKSKFDNQGNFSFGITEYLNIPEVEYDPNIGIIGLEVAVTLMKPGFRIKRKRVKTRKIPKKHRISKEEAISFITNKYNIQVEEK